jgi:PAS domain S-box-containing protein
MKYWLALFIVLLLILDVVWLLDGFLGVQYSKVLSENAYRNQSTSYSYKMFASSPVKSLYYRIIISLLILTSLIIVMLFIKQLRFYHNMLDISNLQYRKLFMEMRTGFALRKVIRDPAGKLTDIRFLEVNPAFREYTGINDQDVTGRSIKSVFPSLSEELIAEYDRISLYGGTYSTIHKLDYQDKIVRLTAYQHSENVFATLIEDISKEKKIEAKLLASNSELTELKEKLEKEVETRVSELREKDLLMIRQSRQAAMGEMIGNIAHQWRQPLNSIAVIIQDLLEAWDFNELNREYLKEKIDLSMSVLHHMSNTIDDFRDFFSPNKQAAQFDIDVQIKKTLNILQDMYSNLGIKIEANLNKCQVTSYAREFSQVLINILNNAKDALQEQKVTDPVIKVDLYCDDGYAIIDIKDNGGGIDPSILEKVFDPYFTTKQSSVGTGVGLYMSKTIVEKHMKGEISAANESDGAIFRIRLPLLVKE